jgi:hypothetical protein
MQEEKKQRKQSMPKMTCMVVHTVGKTPPFGKPTQPSCKSTKAFLQVGGFLQVPTSFLQVPKLSCQLTKLRPPAWQHAGEHFKSLQRLQKQCKYWPSA